MIRAFRLFLARYYLGPQVGQWQMRPIYWQGKSWVRRLTPRGTYEYRLMTEAEEADSVSSEAW